MYHNAWYLLQLFADGEGESASPAPAEGTEQAVTAGSADQGELLSRGFSSAQIEKIQKFQARRAQSKAAAAQQQTEAKPQQNTAAAPEAAPAEEKVEEVKKQSLKQLLKDSPDLNKEFQLMMSSRVKEDKGKAANYDKMGRLIQLMAEHYGMDAANLDFDKFLETAEKDESWISDGAQKKATQYGVPYEVGVELERQEKENQWFHQEAEKRQEQERITIEQQKNERHIQNLIQQGAELKKMYPDFDLRTEMQNPAFLRMTGPNMNIPVDVAYRAIHAAEIDQAIKAKAAQEAQANISRAIQSGSRRPTESGTSAQSPSTATFNYRSASRGQREAFKRSLQQAWARGETVYPSK